MKREHSKAVQRLTAGKRSGAVAASNTHRRRRWSAPPTKYGYWISPVGRFYVVDGIKHLGFARRRLKRGPGGEGLCNNDWRADLLERGWTRVAMHSGRFVVQLPPRKVHPIVIRRLHWLVRQVQRAGQLPILVEDGLTEAVAGGTTVRPDDPSVLEQWRKIAQRRNVRVNLPSPRR